MDTPMTFDEREVEDLLTMLERFGENALDEPVGDDMVRLLSGRIIEAEADATSRREHGITLSFDPEELAALENISDFCSGSLAGDIGEHDHNDRDIVDRWDDLRDRFEKARHTVSGKPA